MREKLDQGINGIESFSDFLIVYRTQIRQQPAFEESIATRESGASIAAALGMSIDELKMSLNIITLDQAPFDLVPCHLAQLLSKSAGKPLDYLEDKKVFGAVYKDRINLLVNDSQLDFAGSTLYVEKVNGVPAGTLIATKQKHNSGPRIIFESKPQPIAPALFPEANGYGRLATVNELQGFAQFLENTRDYTLVPRIC